MNGSQDSTHLSELPAFDCWHLLESSDIGRVVWTAPQGVAIVPVNYVITDGALWFRTDPSAEIARDGVGAGVAVEVDSLDARARSGWSVIVRGVVELIEAEEAPDEVADLRVWPAGIRNAYVRIEPLQLTGRRLQPPREDAR